ARVMRPVGLRGIGVGTDADHDDFLSVVEELGVLITVLLHLNRSALGPCLREEGDHDRLAAIVAELDRVLEEPVAGRAGQGEVGGVLSDVRGGRGGAWYRLLSPGNGPEQSDPDRGDARLAEKRSHE